MEILTSLHGNKAGLDPNQMLIVPGGLASGAGGSQFAFEAPSIVTFTDDFFGDLLSAEWDAKTGSDGGVVTPTINVQQNGVVRLTTGAGATLTMAVNGVQMQGALTLRAPAQYTQVRTCFEARVKLSAITNIAVFLGITDQTAALEMPINGSGSADGFTTTATDAIGFVFDTTMTTKNWWGIGVANDVDSTGLNFGVAPVAATWETLRVDLETDTTTTGSIARFYRNGVQIGASVTGGPRNSVGLTPVVAAFSRSAASATVDLDYIHVSAARV